MKKILKIAGWTVAVLAVVVFGGGMLLSPKWEVARSRVIPAKPAAIHAYVEDLARWPQWSPFEKEDPAMTIELGATTAGVGAKRSWKSESMGNGSQTIVRSDPAKGIGFRLEIEGFPAFEGEFAYQAVDGGTRVTWTDRGDVGANPIHRWFAQMMGPMMRGTFDKGLASLEAAVAAGK